MEILSQNPTPEFRNWECYTFGIKLYQQTSTAHNMKCLGNLVQPLALVEKIRISFHIHQIIIRRHAVPKKLM